MMKSNYTSQWFRDQLFENALNLYKNHWNVKGKRDAKDISTWLKSEREWLADQNWIHDLFKEYEDTLYKAFGDSYDAEFCEFIQVEIDRYINNGELGDYIHNQMVDYVDDLEYHKDPEKYLGFPYK